jgi:WD40 repeat protein
MKTLTLLILCLAAILSGCAGPSNGTGRNTTPLLARTIVLPGLRHTRPDVGVPGRIDHFAYDPATKRLFVAALENGSLEVLDLDRGERIRSIGGLTEPQGVALVPDRHCVAVACGGDGTLHVYDTRTLEEIRKLDAGPDADNVRYDAHSDTVLVAYGGDGDGAVAVFDTRAWTKVRDIRVKSHPESFQIDPAAGRVFINAPGGVRATNAGSVFVAHRDDGRIETVIPLKKWARNFPMAFDPAHQRLFIATRLPARLIEIDAREGKVLGEAPCTDDSDDLYYDGKTGHVLLIGGGFRPDLQAPGTASPVSPQGEVGALDVFAVGAKGELTRLSTTPTAPHARTGIYVPSRRAIYIAAPFRGNRDAEILEYKID